MNTKSLNEIRMGLLVMIVILFALIAIIFFTKHQFDISIFVVAISCLIIYLVSGKKKT